MKTAVRRRFGERRVLGGLRGLLHALHPTWRICCKIWPIRPILSQYSPIGTAHKRGVECVEWVE
jgi:hypothetical protein